MAAITALTMIVYYALIIFVALSGAWFLESRKVTGALYGVLLFVWTAFEVSTLTWLLLFVMQYGYGFPIKWH